MLLLVTLHLRKTREERGCFWWAGGLQMGTCGTSRLSELYLGGQPRE